MRARSRSSSSSSSVCPLFPARSSASRNLAISSAGLPRMGRHQHMRMQDIIRLCA